MSLSDKIYKPAPRAQRAQRAQRAHDTLSVEDVREFIEELKTSFCYYIHKKQCKGKDRCPHCEKIYKLAGEKLG